MQMRHELKHVINRGDYHVLDGRLSKLFAQDAHVDAKGEYRVRSLYFDTPGDRALREKIDGADPREKFRLRMYNADAACIRLEKKIKINGLCAKRSTALTKAQAERLVEGDARWLYDSGDPLFLELYSNLAGRLLRPKTVVEYIRKPFVFPAGNVRVTLDRDIRTGLTSTGFFREELPLLNTFEAYAVLEVKYDGFLPDLVARAVQIPGRRACSFSKYAACRKYD